MKTSDSITIVWKYETGYEVTYTTDPSAEPHWKNEVTVPEDTSITEVEYKIDNLSPNTIYNIYVRHAKIEVINMYMTFVGGDSAKI